MSALYSLWDVILDGFIHGKDTGSDASEMTSWRNRLKPSVNTDKQSVISLTVIESKDSSLAFVDLIRRVLR